MHARLTTIEVPQDRIDDAPGVIQEQVLLQLKQLDGFKGFIALRDRGSGTVRGVALWESEEVMRTTDEAAARIRSGVEEATGGTVASVENYEVVVFEASTLRGPGKRSHGQPLRRWREAALGKSGHRVLRQEEARAGTDNPPALLLTLIHRSAWNSNSANFAVTEF